MEFPWLVGRYCSYLLPKQAGGTPQIIVDKTSSMTGRLGVYTVLMSTTASNQPDGPPCTPPALPRLACMQFCQVPRTHSELQPIRLLSFLAVRHWSHFRCDRERFQNRNVTKDGDTIELRMNVDVTYCLNDPHLRGASWSALELQPDKKGET